MNAYFESNVDFNSNSRIIEAYFEESVRRQSSAKRVGDLLFGLLTAILSTLTCTKAKCIFKAVSVAVTLCGFVGIIGAMEHGSLGLGAGFLMGMGLVAIEYACLRRRQQ